MNNGFRLELAKLFLAISTGLVITIGLIYKVPLKVIFVRVLIGGTIFTIIGFILGMIVDNEQEKLNIEEQKQKIKSQLKSRYEEALEKKASAEMDFEPLDMDSLTKIVVDSLKD